MAVYQQAAPAKINLALHITRRREDGYHELESLIVFAEVGDNLEAEPADVDSLTISGPFAEGLESGSSNLVLKAVSAFRSRWPHLIPAGIKLHLIKNLPVASGIGGGSADAAAVLRMLVEMAAEKPPLAELMEIATKLGADVPCCFVSRPLVASGIGEILAPVSSFPPLYIVLANPGVGVATADVFRRLESTQNAPLPILPQALTTSAELGTWLAETRNDLEPSAVAQVPAIGALVEDMAGLPGAIMARMSGSGATCFALFSSAEQAHSAAQKLQALYPEYWVAAAPLIQPSS